MSMLVARVKYEETPLPSASRRGHPCSGSARDVNEAHLHSTPTMTFQPLTGVLHQRAVDLHETATTVSIQICDGPEA